MKFIHSFFLCFHRFGIDTSPTVLNNVDCSTSSYLVILQCDYKTSPPLFSCTDDDDVSVVCSKLSTS